MQKYYTLIGRIFLSLIFLFAGFGKITNFEGTQQYMSAHSIPLTGLFLILASLFRSIGSISIIFGFKAKWGSLLLILFLIPTTLIFHTNFSDQIQIIMFLKNLGLMGGLFFIYVFGPGEISFDSKNTKEQ